MWEGQNGGDCGCDIVEIVSERKQCSARLVHGLKRNMWHEIL
jgi:hypothetical protein